MFVAGLARVQAEWSKTLGEIATLFSPDTILRWHRMLVSRKWDTSDRRNSVGRPPIDQELRDLVIHLAKENPRWGYRRLQGELAKLDHEISHETIANILRENGIEPAPQRGMSWSTFLKAHWNSIAAADFFTVEVWTPAGLVTYYVLFVIELATRRVHIAGVTPNPDGVWMRQIGRNPIDDFDGFLAGKRYLIIDRDTKFCAGFRKILGSIGVGCVRLPPRSPNLNAYAERFVRSIREDCLDRMIFFGESSLRHTLREYVQHYHAERPHQGIGNRPIEPVSNIAKDGAIECHERLGGLLKHYYRKAA